MFHRNVIRIFDLFNQKNRAKFPYNRNEKYAHTIDSVDQNQNNQNISENTIHGHGATLNTSGELFDKAS